MKILLTAFDPFGGETVNPAQEALKQIQAPARIWNLLNLLSLPYSELPPSGS